jgi:hypothetical protein
VDFKLENVLVSLHSLKTMGLGPFGTSAPLFLRNGELLGHSPILKRYPGLPTFNYRYITAGNRHKQNSWFCKEIREDNFRFWWRRVHEDASQSMYMSKIEISFFTARILQNQRILCCCECFHD